MGVSNDEIQLITTKPPGPVLKKPLQPPPIIPNHDKMRKSNENLGKTTTKPADTHLRATADAAATGPTNQIDQDAEERQRTGRYLAVGVTLVMLFIAFYHTLLKHTSVLAGLLAPAIIMLIYILWLLYFAKKRKRQYVGRWRLRVLKAEDER